MGGAAGRGETEGSKTQVVAAAANLSVLPFANVARYLFLASRRDVPYKPTRRLFLRCGAGEMIFILCALLLEDCCGAKGY